VGCRESRIDDSRKFLAYHCVDIWYILPWDQVIWQIEKIQEGFISVTKKRRKKEDVGAYWMVNGIINKG